MVPEYPKRLGRIGAVIALLGTLIWVQWPLEMSKLNIAGIVFFVAALITWISVEYTDYWSDDRAKRTDAINSEDALKVNRLLKIIDKRQYYVLKQHAIETYIGAKDYAGLEDLISFRENDIFPFHHEELQSKYDDLCRLSGSFLDGLYGLYTIDGRGRMTWRSSGDSWVSEEIYARVMAKIAGLNNEVSKITALWEEFIKVARRDLKGASQAIEHYEL